MTDTLLPLVHSHEASDLETELKALFIKLYLDALKPVADEINVYGAPHLGSFGLVERNIDQDGLTVLRETTEDRIRYLFKAWRHRNPERGLHFLRLYLRALFGDYAQANQLWHLKTATYPLGVKTALEMTSAGDDPNDYFLTSRVRVDIDTEIVPAKLLASLRSAVAARILLNVRIGKSARMRVGLGIASYGVNVCRLSTIVAPRLRVTGSLADWLPGSDYSSRLSIGGAIGTCTVTVLDGSQLPPSATVAVDNGTREVVVSWPSYGPAMPLDIPLNIEVRDGPRTATWSGFILFASTYVTSTPYAYLASERVGVGFSGHGFEYRVSIHDAVQSDATGIGFSVVGWVFGGSAEPEANEPVDVSYAIQGWTLRPSALETDSGEGVGVSYGISGFSLRPIPVASSGEVTDITFSLQGFTLS